MIDNQKDPKATKLLRSRKEFLDGDSWISFAGHVYKRGQDRSLLRVVVAIEAQFQCAICGEPCPLFDGDLEHVKGGTKIARCDCFHTELAEGSKHTNVQWVHSMRSIHPCHRNKHNREIKWTPRKNS